MNSHLNFLKEWHPFLVCKSPYSECDISTLLRTIRSRKQTCDVAGMLDAITIVLHSLVVWPRFFKKVVQALSHGRGWRRIGWSGCWASNKKLAGRLILLNKLLESVGERYRLRMLLLVMVPKWCSRHWPILQLPRIRHCYNRGRKRTRLTLAEWIISCG